MLMGKHETKAAWDLSCPRVNSSSNNNTNVDKTREPESTLQNDTRQNTNFHIDIDNNNNTIIDINANSCQELDQDADMIANGLINSTNIKSANQRLRLFQMERRARKKDQNRRAALNYRRKKMDEWNRIREEEMKLVYSRVCLIGYADELESSILCLLQTRATKLLRFQESGACIEALLLCPICKESWSSAPELRAHLAARHGHLLELMAAAS